MLACQNGNEQIALELFKLHRIEYQAADTNSSIHQDSNTNRSLETSSWYFHIQKAIDECKINSHTNLSTQLADQLIKFKSDLDQKRNSSNQQPTSIMDQIPSPHLAGAAIDPDFNLIENLEDLTSFLNDESVGNIINDKKESEKEEHMQTVLDQNLLNTLDNTLMANFNFQQMNESGQNQIMQSQIAANQQKKLILNNQQIQQQQSMICFTQPKQLIAQISQTKMNDDQDKKIKALADNIIAAMPYKIKTNSYSISNLSQQQQQQKNMSGLIHQQQQQQQQKLFINETELTNTDNRGVIQKGGSNVLRRYATSFDDGYETSYRTSDSGMSLGESMF
jgi:hypothetical protein